MGFYKQLSQTIYYILRSLKMFFTKKNMFFFFFIAVFVACCVFSNKVFAEESIQWDVAHDLQFRSGQLVYEEGNDLIYFHGDNRYIYTLSNYWNSRANIRVTTTSPSAGVPYTNLTYVEPGQSYSFVGSDFYLTSDTFQDFITITRVPINQYDNTIDSLTQAISLDNLWSQFGVGLIVLAVLFAIGFFVVRKVLEKDSQYKG